MVALDHRGLGRAVSRVPDGSDHRRWGELFPGFLVALDHRGLGS